jgi:hypothetical protein
LRGRLDLSARYLAVRGIYDDLVLDTLGTWGLHGRLELAAL